MKAANTQLIEDINKTIAAVEAADFAYEANPGYEEQGRENQEMVLINLREALEEAKKEDHESAAWWVGEAARCERRGGFDSVYTDALEGTYCD